MNYQNHSCRGRRPPCALMRLLITASAIGCSTSNTFESTDSPTLEDKDLHEANLILDSAVIPIRYKVQNGIPTWQDDIDLRFHDDGWTSDINRPNQRNGITIGDRTVVSNQLWPNATVPYRFDTSIDATRQAMIQRAISHWNFRTPLLFIFDRNNTAANYIRFRDNNTGCHSGLGYSTGINDVFIAAGCGFAATVHEIGHAAGLIHEMARSDRDNFVTIKWANICSGQASQPGGQQCAGNNRTSNFDIANGNATSIGTFDFLSDMLYSATTSDPTFAVDTHDPIITRKDGTLYANPQTADGLSDGDAVAVLSLYPGLIHPSTALKSTCRTAPVPRLSKKRNDIVSAWNNFNQTSVADYPSTGNAFGYWTQWLIQGGWDDSNRWMAGDFNGDGLTDLATIWDEGGLNSIAARRATGSGLVLEAPGPARKAGAFKDSAQWLPGDFNGDGKVDLAVSWNDEGETSVYVLLSTSTIGGPITFANAQAWSIREGGWGDDVKWVVGDFDGDGRADLGAIWNNGDNAIAVRRSTGSSFTLLPSAIHMGGWMPQTKWLAGDFNGDGLSDIAAAWQYGNTVKVAVYTSTGLTSNLFFTGWSQWDEWGGGWMDDANWVAGDFNGDGKCDLGSAWNYNGSNVLTVRSAVTPTGSQLATYFAYPTHWLNPAGGWIPSTQWCAGAFRP